MIAFSCKKCGKQYNLKPEFAGRTTSCSGCKEPLVVPSPAVEAQQTIAPAPKVRIAFSCTKCGMKFSVLPEFAGRATTCATCREKLVVPQSNETVAYVPAAGQIDGTPSSLARADLPNAVPASAAGVSALQGITSDTSGNGARYVVDKELARGGMGAVLRAIDCDIRREVAVKYLLDQNNASNKLRFVAEAQITGQLEHPNIVPIHEIGVDTHKRLFFAMKMVKGRSLGQILKQLRAEPGVAEKEYGLNKLLNILINVCNALAYAHACGVVHRDLKPGNIMVGDFGEVYVMDWGLAKVLDQGPLANSEMGPTLKVMTSRIAEADLTQEGVVLGTPVYMPPEQAAGRIEMIDARSDVYSVGAILYELLTLQSPIDRTGGFLAIVLRVTQGEIVPPEKMAPERAKAGKMPAELTAVAMKALATSKEDRYPTIEALRKDIELFVEGRSVSAKQDTVWEFLLKVARRNKGVSIATAAALVVLTLVAGVFLKINYSARVLAENNHAAYLKEQEQRIKQGRDSVPSMLTAATLLIEKRNFAAARAQVQVALDFDPEHAELRNLRGQLALIAQDFVQAKKDLEAYAKLRPGDKLTRELLQWLSRAKTDDTNSKLLLAESFTAFQAYALADGALQSLGETAQAAREEQLALYRQRLEKAWPGKGQRLTLNGAKGTFHLNQLYANTITDLSPLRGMPLTSLDLGACSQLQDLEPLRGMPVTSLNLAGCIQLQDLGPLRGMPLTELNLLNSGVKELGPLQGLPLASLVLPWQVRDLGPLRGLPLTSLVIGRNDVVEDIEPLRGMQLKSLNLYYCPKVRTIEPLKGMPLTWLDITNMPISDLEPLKGMKLTALKVGSTKVRDLRPLKDMPLTTLNLSNLLVEDLAALEGMKLASLDLGMCSHLRDLNSLKCMPLRELRIHGTGVTDLTPLQEMQLDEIHLTPKNITSGLDILRKMESLRMIGIGINHTTVWPAPVFWKKLAAGEFK